MTATYNVMYVAIMTCIIICMLGVAVGLDFCNQESLSETSQTFWTFSTGNYLVGCLWVRNEDQFLEAIFM